MERRFPPTRAAVDRAATSDARLAVTIVVAAVIGFVALVVLPYAVTGFAPPAGTDVLWRVGGPLAVVLAPLGAGLAAAASLLALLRDGGPGGTTRHLHVAVLVTAATFAAFLVSPAGQSVLGWWQD
ncbi:hypothetical protein ASC64_18395 [Nocardioides sp. Root122]|uniref:hypothetical protein n=1 Tax=Nocardioides TaxID=1839 RepID=UPI00070273A7|nr:MULTISPECIES: hypothetical protein [Nocardioides]KQV73413.1 hypothetical protein ASC64_18395 [Nocardioides sp. Root122]MCK9825617.1 hypothetical protein [Nocardioides cavernae]